MGQQETVREITNPNPNRRGTEMLINCHMWTTSPRTRILLKASFSWTCGEDGAVIQMIIRKRRPTMRHVPRTQRVAFDWFSDRILFDAKIQIKFVDTKKNNARTCWPKVVVHVMNGTIFHCWRTWISRCLPAAIFFQTEGRVSCPRELRKARQKRVRQWRNRDRWIWCQGTFLSAKKNPSARSGCFEQPRNQELDQSHVSSSARKLVRNNNQDPTMYSQERRKNDT